jgi:hypothetical protein
MSNETMNRKEAHQVTVEEPEPRAVIPVRIDCRCIGDVVVRPGAKLAAPLVEFRPHRLALAARADGVSEHVATHQAAFVLP